MSERVSSLKEFKILLKLFTELWYLEGLEKTFYPSINSMSRNLETIFLPPVPKMCNFIDKSKILMTKLEL